MADLPPFTIADIRGGINNSDSPTLLADNAVVDARNIDFRDGALGAKRRGCAAVSMTSAIFDSAVIALIRHTPTNLVANDELWGIDINGNIDRRVAGVWQGGVARVNTSVAVYGAGTNYDANGVSLHGKLFLAAYSGVDRVLVWDGTVLRWAGFNINPTPSVADSAAGGAYTGVRYFRTRFTQQAAGVTIRRSEPSTAVTFTPSGSKTGAVVSKATGTEVNTSIYCEAQTHWEVEASLDSVLFYRIATVAVGTANYTDTTAYSTGYASNPLSETIGEYTAPRAWRHVAVDEDRILGGGSHVYPALDSTVWWTPVNGDDGVGNDERIPTETNQFITFDGLDGGAVTALVGGVNSFIHVLKRQRIYKMGRTGVQAGAYDPIFVTATRGATPRGACAGIDTDGAACIYFTDPDAGLCRYGSRGVERLGDSVRVTWKTRNKKATIQTRIAYYPDLEQVWYPVATGAATTPDLMFFHEVRYGANLFHSGVPATARALCMFPNLTTDTLRPFLGTASGSYVHEADTGVNDAGTSYQAYVTTKPYALGNLWQKFGLMAGVLLAKATTSTTINIALIRNFAIETLTKTVSLTPAAAETRVIRTLDNATMSELNVLQLTYGDSAASDQAWSLDQFAFRIRAEEDSA